MSLGVITKSHDVTTMTIPAQHFNDLNIFPHVTRIIAMRRQAKIKSE
jgi:hypothetical protein